LQSALVKKPGDIGLLFLLGRVYARSGEGDKALAAFQKELEIDSSTMSLNGVGFELADANVRVAEAARYAEQAVEQQEEETDGISLAALTISDLRKMPTLAAVWDTLGWAYFRIGRNEQAEKYLNAAWKLAQFPDIGDHLGQFYEKAGDKQRAARYYTLSLATNHAPQETRQRLEALLGGKARADEEVRASLEALGQQRTVKLARIAKGPASAEFFVLFTSVSGISAVKFINGSDELRDAKDAISSASYDVSFPDARSVKLLRRGMVVCSGSAACQFFLLPPESVNSLN
jgi:tetratricopeptide (TPR) repeat protein